MTKVLILATSRKTRGGITSVVKSHETGEQWNEFHCRWIETHRDKNILIKFLFFLRSFIEYICVLPFYDIVHVHIGAAPSAYRKCVFVFFAKLFRKKMIVHFHAFSPVTTIQSKWHGAYDYLFGKADIIIVLSEYWKNVLIQHYDKKQTNPISNKLRIVYNPITKGVDDCIVSNNIVKRKTILYAGTVSERKGYADLLYAFGKIADNHKEWSLVFAGNGDIENGCTIARKLNIERQVEWLGWVSGTDKDKAFSEASVFCLPSYAEGFPMGVLDAWAYGLPVITTPVGGIPDVANDGMNLLLFNPGDVDKLTDCLTLMIDDEELRNNISKESTKFADGKFNKDTINNQIKEIYASLA